MVDGTAEDEAAYFEERADDLEFDQLSAYDVRPDLFRSIQRNLTSRGAKLLVGPRGCGKTHQIRLAYRRSLADKKKPLPVYVSFARYLFLEPLLSKSTIAIQTFHSWVLARLALGLHQTALELQIESPLEDWAERLDALVPALERGTVGFQEREISEQLSIQKLLNWIEVALVRTGRSRAVLLMDDAALTLTPPYMVEFFEVFRSLKSPRVAPKASVYPGTTMYGPRFHVGQDAAPVNCWISLEHPDYEPFMLALIERRMKDGLEAPLQRLLAFAAFGIPRNLIGLVRAVTSETGTPQSRFNRAVQDRCQQIEAEYLSLGTKLPEYATVIRSGWNLFQASLTELVERNRKYDGATRQLVLGIESEKDPIQQRMIKLLREVGLFYELADVKHGDGRTYWRLIPHLLFLVERRAFSHDRGFAPDAIAERIASGRSPKHPLRRSIATLLGADEVIQLKLDAPDCQNCGAVRLTREQKFCHSCGRPLITPSVFDTCMGLPLSELPIPKYQVESLAAENVGLRTIGDVVALADPATELRKGKWIGPVRSELILEVLGSFVAEFLER